MEAIFNGHSKSAGIYKITNRQNGRVYYGSALNLGVRFWHHKNGLLKQKHANQFLQHDYNKCGSDVFVFEVIEVIQDKDLLLEIEQSYLNKFFDGKKMCYNIQPIAGRNTLKHTDETKKKIGEKSVLAWANTSDERKQELAAKRSVMSKSHWENPEYRTKIKASSIVGAAKISAIQKAKAATPEGRKLLLDRLAVAQQKKVKTVTLISPDGEVVTITNLYKWCRDNSYSYEGMRWITRGKNHSHKGWRLNQAE